MVTRLNERLRGGNVGASPIRIWSDLARKEGAINLSQGFPDFDPPKELKEAAARAIQEGHNQYTPPSGVPEFRLAISEKAARYNNIEADPGTEITVTVGATEALKSTLEAICNEGDEVVFFEPAHEMYPAQSKLLGLTPKAVPLHGPNWDYNKSELEGAITDKTAAIIINTPHNPTGKVFSSEELEHIASLCLEHDTYAITDEIYEHILYDGAEHISMATLPGMKERTFTINALTKTYAVTGWRVGWVISPEEYTPYLRAVHDQSVIQAPTPLQVAGVTALSLGNGYYQELAHDYRERRDTLIGGLEEAGFTVPKPQGAYYLLADFSGIAPDLNADEFTMKLVTEAKVGAIPGTVFYSTPGLGEQELRFAFSKKIETLEAAAQNLKRM